MGFGADTTITIVQADRGTIAYPSLQQLSAGLVLELAQTQTQIRRIETVLVATSLSAARVDETHYLAEGH